MIKKPSNLSLIIPCYNEESNLPLLFEKLKEIQNKCHEIFLVDNGSTDDTSKVIERFIKNKDKRLKILKIKTNIGYGHGIMSGVREASGQIIAWTHADLQTDPKDVINAYELFISTKQNHKFVLKGKRKKRNLFDKNQSTNNLNSSNSFERQSNTNQKSINDNVQMVNEVEGPQVAPPGRSDLTDITSPMVGTFYRAAAPGEDPFVEVGNNIKVGQTICILEAMKLMNEIESEFNAEIVEILVENGTPVEFGQVLMRVKQS